MNPLVASAVRVQTALTYEPGGRLVTISAVDLIVMKALAGRPTDLRDIAGIAHRQGESLDHDAIIERATALREIAAESSFLSTLHAILEQPTDYL